MLRELWAEQVSNDEVLEKLETKGTLILNIKKRHLKFLGHIIRKEDVENLILTGQRNTTHDLAKALQ